MNNRTTPKDFFLHLGATVALYAAVIALVNLSFSIINYVYPDKLAGYFTASSIAWPVSMLLVLVPVLYVIEWLLVRDVRRMPEKAEIWVRRWRIYLTLFLSGATIVGDLIALVNTYLSGEISSRFVWKVVAILVICGVVFAYYLLARAMNESRARTARRILAVAGLVLILAAVIGGFVIVGSPSKQRDIRFDSQRVSDLTNIQWRLVNAWQQTGKLPQSLDALRDPISGANIPTDPETGAAYAYTAKSGTAPTDSSMPSFELCATFALPSQDVNGRGVYQGSGGANGSMIAPTVAPVPYPGNSMDNNWTHGPGRVCFVRTIDPNRYPVIPKTK